MHPAVIAAIVAIAAVAAWLAAWLAARRSTTAPPAPAATRVHPAPPVEGFHVHHDTATVSFDVPLPAGAIDDVLADLLIHEAIEVVREKRHHLPIAEVTRVVAMGRRDGEWVEAGSTSLDTPGELPLLDPPELIPGLHEGRTLDLFDHVTDLPEDAPGLAAGGGGDHLAPLASELRIPAALAAGLRAQGIDPTAGDAGDLVVGILRLTGAAVTPEGPGTYQAVIAGRPTLVRVVPHVPGDHPELSDTDIRRFAADAASSKTERALLITEKYAPFEVYERERRDPSSRYITRERVQHFIDSLALR